MLIKSNRTWKYAAMVGGAVLAPMLYLFVNQWKGEGLPLMCWAVIGAAAGWDLARMLLGEKLVGRKRQPLWHQPADEWVLFDDADEKSREFMERMDRELSHHLDDMRERALEKCLQDHEYFDRDDRYQALS